MTAPKASKPAIPKPKAADTPPVRQRADWQAIERDYRTGKFSATELALKHGGIVTPQAINKRARLKEWKKDLTAAVRAATKAKLIHATEVSERQKVSAEVSEKVSKGIASDETLVAVLAVAEVNTQVIMNHREDLKTLRSLTMSMVRELQAVSLDPKRVQALHDILTSGEDLTADQVTEARDAFNDLTRLPSRAVTIQRLTQSMTRLQQMERVAFSLDEPDDPASADVGTTPTLSDAQRASRMAALFRRRGLDVIDV